MRTLTIALYALGGVFELVGLVINFRGFKHIGEYLGQTLDRTVRRMRRPQHHEAHAQTAMVMSSTASATVRRVLPAQNTPAFHAKLEDLFNLIEGQVDLLSEGMNLLDAKLSLLREQVEVGNIPNNLEFDKSARKELKNVVKGWMFLFLGFIFQAVSQVIQFSMPT